MDLLAGLTPAHLRALDHRLRGGLVAALRDVLEAGHRPTLGASWVPEARHWRVLVRGLGVDDVVVTEMILTAEPGSVGDVATLALIHLSVASYREDLVAAVLHASRNQETSRCPLS